MRTTRREALSGRLRIAHRRKSSKTWPQRAARMMIEAAKCSECSLMSRSSAGHRQGPTIRRACPR